MNFQKLKSLLFLQL